MTRKRVLTRLGPPRNHVRRADRWCLVGRGQLRIGRGLADLKRYLRG